METSIDVNVLVIVARYCRKRRIRTVRPTRWHRNGEEDQLRDLQTAVQEKADEESVLRVPERPLTPISSSSCVPESRPPVSSPQSGLRSRSLPNISPGAERVRGTNAQERRPITPSGTGTIVIVQGVVHTSDSASQRLSPGASRPAPSAPSVRTPGDMLSHNSHSHSNSDHGHIDDDNSESHDERSSEDESETELSASSIEILCTLLGLNLDDRSEELDNSSGDDQRSERSLTLEGSFERFLHNLQDDLRTALVEDYASRRARATVSRYVSTAESNTNDEQPTPIPVATVETSADVPPTCAQDTMASECVPEAIPGEETVMILQVDPAVLSTVQEESSTSSMSEPSQPSVQPANSDPPRPANVDLPPLRDAISQPGDTSSQPPQARGVTGQPGAVINL
ncbi:hypothetical protein M422DRAFT_274660 [Sphaerobolus stellatus SS14]|uniref:Uncharacterized protein n=1 Tax=Sphaerobolus stellatus (strain SS14) TaxID=990650 RepID=A0A0C9UH69_SPHS4|nr:hypothetical protein M422DRAFT_274660 [Sphaerobolus stellatus SS14]